MLKSKSKIDEAMETSRLNIKPWRDVNDTDSTFFSLKKDREYLRSKKLDHLSKEKLLERGLEIDQSPRDTQASNMKGKLYRSN